MIDVKKILISMFKGFSSHVAKVPLLQKLREIASTTHQKTVDRVRALLREGKKEEADRVKKQLPPCTFSATYRERRIPEMIESYNDIQIMDFDDLTAAQMECCRKKIKEDRSTLFVFTSPSGSGLKAGVYLLTEQAQRLREELLRKTEITYEELDRYHKLMFKLCQTYYEALCKNVVIDDSGSDIGRLCFMSYDPDIYVNEWALARISLPADLHILPPAPKMKKTPKQMLKEDMPGNENIDCGEISLQTQMDFQKCVRNLQRQETYEQGNRDTFIYNLGNRCYRKDLPQESVVRLTEKYFGAPDLDVSKIIANAYHYTSKTEEQETEKQKSIAMRSIEFIDERYDIRRNVVLERLEFREKGVKNKSDEFVPMKKMHYNTIFYDLQMNGIPCNANVVKSLIDSRYAKDFNPFATYFYGLPPYKGKRDYIAELAATVTTTNQVFWADCLKRWLVGLVACALDENVVNQIAIVMRGEQGKGKSSWIRHLTPPELKLHYRNGMLNPDNKDHMIFLSLCLIINLEEFEGMGIGSIAELKRLITQESVRERKAFEMDADLYIRRCSFIASTNEPRFLQDTSGTRRLPTVTALDIDYRTPVNHAGIYAQALYLWQHDFHYWYEHDEISMLNEQNRQYTLSSLEEELLYVCYRKPLATDLSMRWMPAASILGYISTNGRVQANDKSIRNLIKILERDGFRKRINENNICEYEVVQYSFEEIDTNYKQRKEEEPDQRIAQEILPF